MNTLREAGCYSELPNCLLRVVYASKFIVRLPLIFFCFFSKFRF